MNILSLPEAATSPVILPDELIMEILSFCPVKSLMRMKCVCMSWETLISNPTFVKLHIKKQSTTNTTHLTLLHPDKSKSSLSVVSISVRHFLQSRSKHYYQSRFTFDGKIVGSCNGLICLLSSRILKPNQEHQFYLWNPATRRNFEPLYPYHKSIYNWFEKYLFAFGYDNSTDTYKVVVLTFRTASVDINRQVSPEVRVFTFGDNIWRDIQSFTLPVYINRSTEQQSTGVYLNNTVNWFVLCQYYCYLKDITSDRFVIISLDLRTETFTQFLLPSCWEVPLDNHYSTLSVLMDCLCFSYNFDTSDFVIWQMKKFGVEESWTRFLKIRNLNIQIRIHGIVSRLTPLCFSENGDILILAINDDGEAIFYDWRNNRVKRVVNTNILDLYTAKGYFESLVSAI